MVRCPLSGRAFSISRWLISQTDTFTTRLAIKLTALFWLRSFWLVFSSLSLVYSGYLVAAVTLSLCVLAAMRLVPLYERFAIWVVPSLYLGIALCIDAGIRAGQNAYRQRRHVHTATAVLVTVAVLWLCGNVAAQGWHVIQIARPDSNHQLDDRMAVEWLLAQHERGDVVLTTRLALLRCGVRRRVRFVADTRWLPARSRPDPRGRPR